MLPILDFLVSAAGVALDPLVLAIAATLAYIGRRWWISAAGALPLAWAVTQLDVAGPAVATSGALASCLALQALFQAWRVRRASRPRT